MLEPGLVVEPGHPQIKVESVESWWNRDTQELVGWNRDTHKSTGR